MRFDHDSCQVMKFIDMRTSCSVAIQNMGLKQELILQKQLVLFFCVNTFFVLNMSSKHLALQVIKPV